MKTFVAYEGALELVRALRPIVEALRSDSRDLADQIERAGTSIVLNLAEGNRRAGKDRRRFFVYAQGSGAEVKAALEVADAWGWVVDTARARELLDRELRLLWGLTHASSRPTG
jgi:four helix bundle protein